MTPRKQIRLPLDVYQEEHVYYLTMCTHQRRPWFAGSNGLAQSFVDHLVALAHEREAKLFAWCVMPGHGHFLIQGSDLIALVRLLKGRIAQDARPRTKGARLWQRSFFDRALRNEQSVLDVARYVWANPVRGGLVKHPGEYAWSGSRTWPDWRKEFGRG